MAFVSFQYTGAIYLNTIPSRTPPPQPERFKLSDLDCTGIRHIAGTQLCDSPKNASQT